MRSVSADATSGIRLTVAHYLEALRSCAAVVDKPGGGQARSAAIAALELLQDIREARWLSGRQGEDAYFWAMKTCIAAQDAWSALALLESAQDDRVRRNMALRTAAMQVTKTPAVTAGFPNQQVCRVLFFLCQYSLPLVRHYGGRRPRPDEECIPKRGARVVVIFVSYTVTVDHSVG